MGLLYGTSASLAFSYAALVAGIAGLVVVRAVPALRSQDRRHDHDDGGNVAS